MDQSDIVGPSEVFLPGSDRLLLMLSVVLGAAAMVGLVVALVVRRRRRGSRVDPKRPVGTAVAASLLALALVVGLVNRPPPFFVPEFPALPQLFPDDAFFYRDVTDLDRSNRSDRVIASLGGLALRPAASSVVHNGMVSGKPFNLVDDSTERHRLALQFEAASDDVEYPITEPAYIQSMPTYGIDEHYIGIDLDARRMWELWETSNWFGTWRAGSGAEWDLDSLEYPKGRTTASGFPMQPMSFTYAQVATGSVDHAIFAGTPVVAAGHVWPARRSDGRSDDPDAPPMGSWLRLRSDADLSGLGAQARVIAEAMQRHGVLIGDTGGVFALVGTPDARWDDADLATLSTLSTDDLEVLDASGLIVEPGSMAAVPPG